jgi:ribosomal protein S18 acetylase RimI-like enzyme
MTISFAPIARYKSMTFLEPSAYSTDSINLRPLVAADIPRLPEIRPSYTSNTIIVVEHTGSGFDIQWKLAERDLPEPFSKGNLYDFNEDAQQSIRERFERPDDSYQRVLEHNGRLIGLLEIEQHYWNDTVFLWTLMIDQDYRGQGLGRRLWHRAVEYARECGVRAIMIETQNTNPAACKFYMRMGCELVGLNESYYTNNSYKSEIALFWAYYLRDGRSGSFSA